MAKKDPRLDLRWGVMFKGRLIMACISKTRAERFVELGNRDTPEGGVTLRDFEGNEHAPIVPAAEAMIDEEMENDGLCTCKDHGCTEFACKGKCGCKKCHCAYQDQLSVDY